MLISFESAMGIHPRVAQLRSSQIAIQSGNIFNIETPQYRALEANLNFYHSAYGLSQDLSVSDKRHITPNQLTDVELSIAFKNSGGIASENGNDVSLALEQAKLAQSMAGYNISISLIRERLSMLDKVISGR
ncbi:flagellar basal body rod protein FlgB [Endozoicomonas acroporae]|uniref:flagellar basal body rod protein FlgB n=1 Tax=Endozoicomonas acroporae TaxID=1701104 RepID=UPI003D78E6ED